MSKPDLTPCLKDALAKPLASAEFDLKEALEDVLGRVISYAGLLYAGNSTDPKIGKFYGDMQERITAASIPTPGTIRPMCWSMSTT